MVLPEHAPAQSFPHGAFPKGLSLPLSSMVRPLQGVDFFFSNRAHALKFISFVQSVVPAKYRSDKQLVSHNEHSATYNYKYTFSVEIVPVCRVSPAVAASAFMDGGHELLTDRAASVVSLQL